VSYWPAWAAQRSRIISARQPGHPSSGRTCRKSTTVRLTRRNSCRYTSPPLRQQVETRRNGNIFSRMAHEPYPRINLLLGRALHEVSKRREQTSKDGSPPRRRPSKERADSGEVAAGEPDLGYQSPEGGPKGRFHRRLQIR
jgi:hypothetical protein